MTPDPMSPGPLFWTALAVLLTFAGAVLGVIAAIGAGDGRGTGRWRRRGRRSCGTTAASSRRKTTPRRRHLASGRDAAGPEPAARTRPRCLPPGLPGRPLNKTKEAGGALACRAQRMPPGAGDGSRFDTGRQDVAGTGRFLRSAKRRALLWLSTEGRCTRCGAELPEDAFEADHIEPYSRTHRTNMHEMQPLCPRCNQEKGDRE